MGCNSSRTAKAPVAKEQPQADRSVLAPVTEEKEAKPEEVPAVQAQGEPEPEAGTPAIAAEAQLLTAKVTVVGARGLRNADWIGKSEPYCVVEIAGKEESMNRTPFVKHEAEVAWNFAVEVAGYKAGDALVFTVKDNDAGKKDDVLGTVTLAEDRVKEGFEGELELTGTGEGCQAFLKVKVEATEPSMLQQAQDAVEHVKEVIEDKVEDVKEAAGKLADMVQETVEQVVVDAEHEVEDSSKSKCCKC